jgi:NAD(P)-dependent dehydrogenase (short-subunit alcohol dehydrogenase family)
MTEETGSRSSLAGKAVVVTGAGRGIGRDVALLAAAEGAAVVVNDLGGASEGTGSDPGPAHAVVEEIQAAGGTAVANTSSVADKAGAQEIIDTALGSFGRLDVVVNNAGILRDKIFHQMSSDDFDRVVRVHLYGSFYMSHAAAPHFRKQEHGAFVHFTSTSGLIGNLGQANYSAAKLGIVGLSRSIALDMERFNVRSNCIAPFAWSRLIGTIPTESEDESNRVERFKSMGTEKIAPLAVYLGSDLSAGTTGQIFGVRRNEIFLFSQPRPVRSVHRGEGWTVQTIAEQMAPAFAQSLCPLERSADVFSWDPI